MSSPGGQNEWLTTNRDELFSELWSECLRTPPQAGFSSRLRTRLERVEPEARTALVSRLRDGCAPLMLVATTGSLELVNYLLHVCLAPVNQLGLYTVAGGGRAHIVTPLWAAAVAGHLSVVVALDEAGADIDEPSDSGSTPLRSACFMTREHVARYLIEQGADVSRPNHSGGTCLINAVQSASLCQLLLAHNAPVDATDLQGKTALHYAVQESRLQTVTLLLKHGADPRKKSVSGDDALRTAACRAPNSILNMLLQRSEYSVSEKYDALLLAGATALDETDDTSVACRYWREAVEFRLRSPFPPVLPPRSPRPPPALAPHVELASRDDVTALERDADAVRAQALLVVYRVLGPRHQHTLYRIVYRGAAYVDALCYSRCIPLWMWALELRLQRDTILCTEASTLIQHRPQCRAQTEAFDRTLRALTHVLHLQLEGAADDKQRFEVMKQIYRLVKMEVQSVATGDTLLHLAVSRLNVLRTDNDQHGKALFPSLLLSRGLVRAGSSVRARNLARCSPLHVAALPYNMRDELILILLEADGHLDTPNRFGESGATLCLRANSQLAPLRYITLQCLAAVATLQVDPNVDHYPEHLHEFLRLHLA